MYGNREQRREPQLPAPGLTNTSIFVDVSHRLRPCRPLGECLPSSNYRSREVPLTSTGPLLDSCSYVCPPGGYLAHPRRARHRGEGFIHQSGLLRVSRMTAHFEAQTEAYRAERACEQNRRPEARSGSLLPSLRHMRWLRLLSSGANLPQPRVGPHDWSTQEWSCPGKEDQFSRP